MRKAALLLAAATIAGALAGCAEDPPVDGRELTRQEIAFAIGKPVVVDHDHTDARAHRGRHNVDFVAWSPLDVELGQNGFANFVLHEADGRLLAFVAVDGDSEGGFTVADVTDPANITVVGSYRAPGSGFQEVRVSPDGRHAVLNVQDVPGASTGSPGLPSLDDPLGLAAACSVCIHVVGLEDLARPRLVSVLPVEALGTHNMDFVVMDGQTYLLYVGQPAVSQLQGRNANAVGNRIGVARLVDGPGGAVLVPVDSFSHGNLDDAAPSFPHDVVAATHPVTGQTLAYVSQWQGGFVVFDLGTSPVAQVGIHADPAPSDVLNIHWIAQENATRTNGPAAGKLIAWSAPEIQALETGTGVIRAMDVTDPANPAQLGTWQLPGELSIPGQFLLSPHTAIPDMQTGLLAVSHYHAGVWVLDATDPADLYALGYYMPHGDPADPHDGPIWWKKPNFDPEGFLPNVYQARWHDGLLWVTERGTGLYALRYTGPVPGPLV